MLMMHESKDEKTSMTDRYTTWTWRAHLRDRCPLA